MKIGLVIPNIPDPRRRMGSKRLFLHLAEDFARKGHDVTIFTTEPRSEIPKRISFHGTAYAYLTEHEILSKLLGRKISRSFDLPFTVSLFQETLFKRQEALVSINDVRPFIVPNIGGKNLSLHVLPPFFSPPKSSKVQRILKADISICCSKFLADTTRKLFPSVSKEFTFVHNGIDCSRFSRGDGEKCRKKLKIPSDHFVVLFVGQLGEQKGVIYLVRAFKEFHYQNHKSSLILVGGTNLWSMRPKALARFESYYTEVIDESGHLPVYFASRVPNEELPDYYAAADVFVCPSIWQETFGLVNIEAMAAGKPVVATSVGGIPEIVRNEETGFLVPPGDPVPIAEKLFSLSKDEKLRRSMGERGRKIAETCFSLDQMVDGYLSKLVL